MVQLSTEKLDPGKYCEIYLFRHGATEANRDRVVSGHFETKLTPEGILEIEQRAGELAGVQFDAAYSSDLSRAVHTAELLLKEKQLIVKTRESLRERFYGVFEGKHSDEYIALLKEMYPAYPNLTVDEDFGLKVHESMESKAEAAERILLALREISVGHIGQRVLVVAHGTVIRSMLVKVGVGNLSDFPPGSFNNGSYIRMFSDGVDFFVHEINQRV